MTYTEADVARLADIISEAQKRGIKHGSYTLARWILTAWQVEGSTPIASPAPERCDAKLSDANEGDLHCERLEGHDGRHLDSGLTWLGDDPDTIGPLAQLHDGAAPAGEVVSVPPPARVEVEVELLKVLYDMVVGSLDWGSGFFSLDEVDAALHVGRLLGVEDSKPPNEREPHLWHQDCALPWRCGQSAGAEIHRVEMPHA